LRTEHPSLPSLPLFTVIARETPVPTVIASEVQRNEAICLIEGQIASTPTPIPTLGLRNDVNNNKKILLLFAIKKQMNL